MTDGNCLQIMLRLKVVTLCVDMSVHGTQPEPITVLSNRISAEQTAALLFKGDASKFRKYTKSPYPEMVVKKITCSLTFLTSVL